MDQIRGSLNVVKVDEHTWDVIILAEAAALSAFIEVYPNLFYVEKSVFSDEPAVVVPEFGSKDHAETWAEYWRVAFLDPDNACDSCPTVQQFMESIERQRAEKTK